MYFKLKIYQHMEENKSTISDTSSIEQNAQYVAVQVHHQLATV